MMAMAALIEQDVNKPHSISSTLFPRIPGEWWYRLITRPLLPRFLGKGSATSKGEGGGGGGGVSYNLFPGKK